MNMEATTGSRIFDNSNSGQFSRGDYTFYTPSAGPKGIKTFGELPEHYKKWLTFEMRREDWPVNHQYKVIEMMESGYVAQARKAYQSGRQVLTARDILEKRIEFVKEPEVVDFLRGLYTDESKKVFTQLDYRKMCESEKLRWFIQLNTVTAMVRHGRKLAILPKSSTLEEVAKGNDEILTQKNHRSLLLDVFQRYDGKSKAYILNLPEQLNWPIQSESNKRLFRDIFVALSDGDEKLVESYYKTMASIMYPKGIAPNAFSRMEVPIEDLGLVALCEHNELLSVLPQETEDGLVPVSLKGIASVLERSYYGFIDHNLETGKPELICDLEEGGREDLVSEGRLSMPGADWSFGKSSVYTLSTALAAIKRNR